MSVETVYVDHHATTPCDPRVVEKMLPCFGELFGNPASIGHVHGRRAATILEESRASIADFLGARPNEIYFTAGATESNNIALRGLTGVEAGLVTTAVEHKSVLVPAAQLARSGVEVTYLQPDDQGFISPADVEKAITPRTRLVSVMFANGEIGTIQPLREISKVCRERDVLLHTDATQAVGKIPCRVDELPCDLLSLSAHKIYGPKGIGALFVRRGVTLAPLIAGGGQEKNVRSGTVNVPGVVGLAEALRIRSRVMADEATRLTRLRNDLWDRLVSEVNEISISGPREQRLPGNLNIVFNRVLADDLIYAMRRFSLSSGSACSSGNPEPSYVLKAIGLSDEDAMSSIRVGLGASNTQEQIDRMIEDFKDAVSRLREISVVRSV